MLACARIGAAHSVIFGGFSPDSIVDRVNDAQCVALITADYGWRRGNKIPLKRNCDIAMEHTPSIKHCIVARRVGDDVFMHAGTRPSGGTSRRRISRPSANLRR